MCSNFRSCILFSICISLSLSLSLQINVAYKSKVKHYALLTPCLHFNDINEFILLGNAIITAASIVAAEQLYYINVPRPLLFKRMGGPRQTRL